MRYIALNQINNCKPNNWDQKAAQWKQLVVAATNKSEKIKKIGNKWAEFKPGFVRNFGDKCWYSEVSRVMTDFDVDHFRPKGAVKKSDGTRPKRTINGAVNMHPGYWWLAFEPLNYRYSCVFSNRPRDKGGKHDYFPLTDENTRVWVTSSMAVHANEQIKLLDPCSINDVSLLSYDKIPGTVQSRFDNVSNHIAYSKVRESCKRYNLNHKTIKGARSKVIKDVMAAMEFIKTCWSFPTNQINPFQKFLPTMEQHLVDACNRKSEFSATAVAFVRPRKAEPWLANILPRLDLTD
jgi:hypothetical protein